MFLFVGIVMAVLQGGIVRRIPEGKEKKAAMGWEIPKQKIIEVENFVNLSEDFCWLFLVLPLLGPVRIFPSFI